MEILRTIGDLLGRRYNTPVIEHKWNHLLGVELELEDVTYAGATDTAPEFDTNDREDWDDLSYEEQDTIRDDWYANNSGIAPAGWTLHNDASLRNGLEFVTTPPVGGAPMQERIDAFYNKKLNYQGGPRTSTHIHIDVCGAMPSVLQSMVMVTYAIEDALFNIVDAGRKWAGYSMALAEMPPSRLRNLLNPASQSQFVQAINPAQNRERYYGLNFNVSRHGTVEFRYFPGAPDKEELERWIDLVVGLKNLGIKYTPTQLAEICNSPFNMYNMLVTELPYWGPRLVASVGMENIFRSFEEINAIRNDDSNPERTSSVVKIEAPFFSFLLNTSLKNSKEAVEYLTHSKVIGKAMALDDAIYYIGNCRSLVKQKKQLFAEEDSYVEEAPHYFGSIDNDADLAPQPTARRYTLNEITPRLTTYTPTPNFTRTERVLPEEYDQWVASIFTRDTNTTTGSN